MKKCLKKWLLYASRVIGSYCGYLDHLSLCCCVDGKGGIVPLWDLPTSEAQKDTVLVAVTDCWLLCPIIWSLSLSEYCLVEAKTLEEGRD